MRRLSVTIAVLTVAVHLGSPVLEACGAKFLVATRIARYQRALFAANPTNILVYRHNSEEEVIEFFAALRVVLEDVGHSVTVVTSQGELQTVARTNDFSLVMMELDTARLLRSDVESWAPDSTLLPIAEYATRPQASRARQEFGQVLKVPARRSEVLSAVHDVVSD